MTKMLMRHVVNSVVALYLILLLSMDNVERE